jgi:hypothetical protein
MLIEICVRYLNQWSASIRNRIVRTPAKRATVQIQDRRPAGSGGETMGGNSAFVQALQKGGVVRSMPIDGVQALKGSQVATAYETLCRSEPAPGKSRRPALLGITRYGDTAFGVPSGRGSQEISAVQIGCLAPRQSPAQATGASLPERGDLLLKNQTATGSIRYYPIGQNIRRGWASIGHNARGPTGDSGRSVGRYSVRARRNLPRHSPLCAVRSSTPRYLLRPRFEVGPKDISRSRRLARRIVVSRVGQR